MASFLQPQPAGQVNLTFGVELEFVLKYDGSMLEGGWDARRAMQLVLESRGLKVVEDDPDDLSYTLWRITKDYSIFPVLASPPHKHTGVELISPVMRGGCHEDFCYSRRYLGDVIELVKDCFDVHVDQSCGLHVHVGSGTSGGFTLQQVKYLAIFFLVFEQELDALHPDNRLDSDYTLRNSKSISLQRTRSVHQAVRLINEALTIREVVQLFSPARRSAYNFKGLVPIGDNPPFGTIEFRQHEGTLDPTAVANWAEVCLGIVEFVCKNEYMIPSLIRKQLHSQYPSRDTVELLMLIGGPQIVSYYAERVYYRRRIPWRENAYREGYFPPMATEIDSSRREAGGPIVPGKSFRTPTIPKPQIAIDIPEARVFRLDLLYGLALVWDKYN